MKVFKLIFIVLSLFINQFASAQAWLHMNPIPTAHDIKSIDFPAIDTGYISDGYNVFKTTNGGQDWEEIFQDGILNSVIDIEFINTSKGFMIGEHYLCTTVDGGQTWSSIFLSTSFSKIYFRTDSIGYLYGHRDWMLKTIDGGQTWFPVNGNSYTYHITDLQFLDDTVGYAITTELNQKRLRKTIDGGLHWSEPLTGFTSDPCALSVISSGEIFLSVKITAYKPPVDVYILHSTDGGNTWAKINMGTSTINFLPSHIHFFNQLEGYVANGIQTYTTSDGGITWRYYNMTNLYPEGYQMTRMSWPDIAHGYTAGYDGLLMKTSDFGETYVSMSHGYTTDFRSVYFTDSLHGFIAGMDYPEPIMLQTFDRGNSWTPCIMDTASVVTDIIFLDQLNGLAAAGRRLLATTDGGYSWSTRYIDPQNSLFKFLSLPDQEHLYALSNGHISFSSDMGYSWSDITPYEGFAGSYFDFPDANTGYAIAHKNTILKTIDGGSTWQEVLALSDDIWYMDFYDYEFGVISYDRGVYITETSGLTWRQETIWAAFPVYVKMLDVDKILIVGIEGEVGVSNNGGSTFSFDYFRSHFGTNRTFQFLDEMHGFVVADNGLFEVYDYNLIFQNVETLLKETNHFAFPNPATEVINFPEEVNANTNLSIYTLDKRLIKSVNIGTKTQVSVSSFPPGTYIIMLRDDDECRVQKLIKL